ncbi:MAG: hypothetical protein A3B30_03395 [Candidatus Komeilibacteria bacterium RIFCSPLOWO2_01_FULL_52_15]|uniref:Galactose-1-phosphate uridyl transferase N-terminal domain-containing protein n=2 Tax=Candidatus Komeiliibacteriota TaxID=1817908 RepID=A0A1G2BPN4_9BACT|nr:MAG: hypothetical protein A2677_01305 [Candidatus Komeilibacteria bacterium RIFCSPHIGHO2_01_FULL_52_14]OGY91058.1 MAG: hypothetical protein A3B30_03395 [Candidatus Komeilibacteria bacterium RIFCSPLOWO2_01_FULL_52_15]
MITKPEIRKDYIQEKYVIIAPRRSKRPNQYKKPTREVRESLSLPSIFSRESLKNEKALLTVGGEKNWIIKVLKNKFPAVDPSFPKAYGYHEVVVETPDPKPELEDLSVKHIAQILHVYGERTTAIARDPRIQYILIFKNNGGRAGASVQHSHSQIFATEFLPPHLLDKSQKEQAYKLRTGRCAYCDVIKNERKGPRLIFHDRHVIAFCPYASQHNYEVWIMPIRHVDNVTQLSRDERNDWATLLKRVLKKVNKLNLPYNFYFHQVVKDEDQHLYLKIIPRGSAWAGVEIGSGIIINPIPPEEAARYYR